MDKVIPFPVTLQSEHDKHINKEHFWRGPRMIDLSSERGKLETGVFAI